MASSYQIRKAIWGTWFPYLVAVLLGAYTIAPFAWMMFTSIKSNLELSQVPPTLFPGDPTFEHFRTLFIGNGLGGPGDNFGRVFLNSVVVSTVSCALSMLIGIPAAYGLSRLRFRYSDLLLVSVIVMRMLPPIALIIPIFQLQVKLGLTNSYSGLIIAYLPLQLPLVVWMLSGFFREIPDELEDAAEVDGAGSLRRLLLVVLPISKPALGITAAFAFLTAWNEFLFALTLSRTIEATTLPVAISGYVSSFQALWGPMAAASAVYALPGIIVVIFSQRYLVRGLSAGAVKG